jgi:hypothetical protein
MEKLIFKVVKKMNEGWFIALVFCSFLLIALTPIIKMIASPDFVLPYSIMVSLPLASYFLSLILLAVVTMPAIVFKIKRLSQIDSGVLSVKQIARDLNVSAIKAFVLLECAERSGEYSREKLKYIPITAKD